jgi:hypothetical protein
MAPAFAKTTTAWQVSRSRRFRKRKTLLALLWLPFCVVFSQILGETIFFCEDEHTKTALVEEGADEWSIAPKSF